MTAHGRAAAPTAAPARPTAGRSRRTPSAVCAVRRTRNTPLAASASHVVRWAPARAGPSARRGDQAAARVEHLDPDAGRRAELVGQRDRPGGRVGVGLRARARRAAPRRRPCRTGPRTRTRRRTRASGPGPGGTRRPARAAWSEPVALERELPRERGVAGVVGLDEVEHVAVARERPSSLRSLEHDVARLAVVAGDGEAEVGDRDVVEPDRLADHVVGDRDLVVGLGRQQVDGQDRDADAAARDRHAQVGVAFDPAGRVEVGAALLQVLHDQRDARRRRGSPGRRRRAGCRRARRRPRRGRSPSTSCRRPRRRW